MFTYVTQSLTYFSSLLSLYPHLSATPAMLVPLANRPAGLLAYHRPHLTSWLASSPNDLPIIPSHMPGDIIDTVIDQWRKRLQACVSANGGHYEHLL